jgi:Family of unknown function (DUF5631)/Family of unknown function (DUF5632)
MTLESASANRSATSLAFDTYADVLQSTRSNALAAQEGVTADDTRAAFQAGEQHARDVSGKQHGIAVSYRSAQRSTQQLRSDLTDIALRGNAEIDRIQNSDQPFATKLEKIVDVLMSAQGEANNKAASHTGNVTSAIQAVLDRHGIDTSAHKFAQSNGVDLDDKYGSPNRDAVHRQVTQMLDGHSSTQQQPDSSNIYSNAENSGAHAPESVGAAKPYNDSSQIYERAQNQLPSGQVPRAAESANTAWLYDKAENQSSPTIAPSPTMRTPTPGLPVTGTTAPAAITQPNPSLRTPSATMPNLPSASTPTAALTPEGLAQNFKAGAQAGTLMSAGTEALSTGAMHAMQPQAPLHTEGMAPPPIAPTGPASGMPLFETAHAATPIDNPAPVVPPADATQTVVATPAAPTAPVMPSTAAAPPIASAGPLPAYGADLRPAAATAPAGPAPMPSATPGSAPVNPANAPLTQPAVVRQQPTATPTPSAAGLTENAVAATATGAATGAGAAQTQAQQRLQRLLDAVARQEPTLRWAIGDRDDGTTVLTTDLASGWIPPDIEIPTGVILLPPGHRHPDLATMLGETTLTVAYTPGQYIPAAEDADPVSMSIRARQTTDVEELGWELAQATKWRDGLPRLAHTLAKAASTGTGYLDSEVDLLREHLATVTKLVLTDYPDTVDSAKVGNWQLLATIDALIKDEKTSANYHLAWFQTLNLAVRGEERR